MYVSTTPIFLLQTNISSYLQPSYNLSTFLPIYAPITNFLLHIYLILTYKFTYLPITNLSSPRARLLIINLFNLTYLTLVYTSLV